MMKSRCGGDITITEDTCQSISRYTPDLDWALDEDVYTDPETGIMYIKTKIK